MRFYSRMSIHRLSGLLLPLLLFPFPSLGAPYTWTDAEVDSPPSTEKGTVKSAHKGQHLVMEAAGNESAGSKWAGQIKGRPLYQDDMVSVVMVSEGSDYIRVNVMYDLPAELAPLADGKTLTIVVMPTDFDLPKGQYTYLSSSMCRPDALSGSVTLRVAMSDSSPSAMSSEAMGVFIYYTDKPGHLEYRLKAAVPYKKSWKEATPIRS